MVVTNAVILFTVLILALGQNTFASDDFYTAAVLEFDPPGGTLPKEIVANNLKKYLSVIDEAKSYDVDILVFPEATLNYNFDGYKEITETAVNLSEVGKETNCDYSYDDTLHQISTKISESKLYVLVNIVEKELCSTSANCSHTGFNLYNSNFVFNRNGCVISRYRKFNLFLEPVMNVTSKADISTFTTDFGVTFGHFVCFDILFNEPAMTLIKQNITHFLYPSMWFSEIPFLTATQIQQSWAFKNNVILLSAGANIPRQGSTGSGIFMGRHGAIELLMAPKKTSKLIINTIPKDINNYDPNKYNRTTEKYTPVELDALKISSFSPIFSRGLPNNNEADEHLIRTCKGKICCEFSIQYQRLTIPKGKIGYVYRLTAFSGHRKYAGIRNAGELYCSIISCTIDSNLGCAKRFEHSENLVPSVEFTSVKIRAIVSLENDPNNYLVMPTSLNFNILPLSVSNFNFSAGEVYNVKSKSFQNFTIDLNSPHKDLMTFGIFGRNFNLDDTEEPSSFLKLTSSSKLISNTSVWLLILIIFIASYLCM